MAVLSAAAPRRVAARAALVERALAGALGPGERVNESRLAAELGLSRTPLREALLQLEGEGWVRAEPNRGFVVRELSAEEARELYPVLWTLEGLAVRESGGLAATLAGEMRRLNARLARAARQPVRALALDRRWHETLLSLCPNRRLLALVRAERRLVERYERLYMSRPELVPRSVAQHEAVIAALEAGDFDAAAARLEDNWRFGLERLLLELGRGKRS